MEKGAATMKRLFLELGGKSATIVLDDADLATATMMGLAVCFHAGQGCAIPTRMLLPRSRYDEGVELLTHDDGQHRPTATRSGPTCSRARRSRPSSAIACSATSRSACRRAPRWRSAAAGPKDLDKGWFVEPTLFADVDNSMTHRPGGDLRPGARRSSRSTTTTTPCASPTTAPTASAARCSPASLERSLAVGQPHPHRRPQRQRRHELRRRPPLRRLQGQRHRPPERHRGLRPVPRDEVARLAGRLTTACSSLTDDQEFFRDTTARFLTEHAPVSELRRLRDDPAGFTAAYWAQGAELGWTSLLVAEAHGGGTISGDGLVDLTLVAHEFGRHAAPGPLVPVNVVAAALSDADTTGDRWTDVLAGLLSGDAARHLVPRRAAAERRAGHDRPRGPRRRRRRRARRASSARWSRPPRPTTCW